MLSQFSFEEHALRQRLNQEFHARPAIPLDVPAIVSHMAFMTDGNSVADEKDHLSRLCSAGVCEFIESSDSHLILKSDKFMLRWERHTEFSSYSFSRPLRPEETIDTAPTALHETLPQWLEAIPGKLIVATHVEVRSTSEITPEEMVKRCVAGTRQVAAAKISGGAGWLFTDFLYDKGFSRFIVIDGSLTKRQAGRTVQRLVEIETYRTLAMLGLPIAKQVGGWLPAAETRLAEMMARIVTTRDPEDEQQFLADLSQLAAEVENSVARTNQRFSASRAYHSFVNQRIEELREERIPGLTIFSEFMQRRLLPAMNTCEAMARRQEELSARVVRSSQLLRTRVDIELEKQNRDQLRQMNKRALLQLRLQQTVENFSAVAITYYGSQLVKVMSYGLEEFIPGLSPEIAAAISAPIILFLSLYGMHQMRLKLSRDDQRNEEIQGI